MPCCAALRRCLSFWHIEHAHLNLCSLYAADLSIKTGKSHVLGWRCAVGLLLKLDWHCTAPDACMQVTATSDHVAKAYELFNASTMAALEAGLGEVGPHETMASSVLAAERLSCWMACQSL